MKLAAIVAIASLAFLPSFAWAHPPRGDGGAQVQRGAHGAKKHHRKHHHKKHLQKHQQKHGMKHAQGGARGGKP
ncbi:MAG: hypothetical protein AABZ53_00930 [Planctomycetota bacterium]